MSAQAPKPIRSPAYPNTNLSDAIGYVRKIEAAYRLSQVDREAAAKLIGYSGLSGPANQALASLAQYGLVERAGKGEMRVTARAQAILHPNSEEEKRSSLREAAFDPQLFQELRERWPNITPPEDGVVTYLNRQGFNQSAIKPAARAYLQTLAFLQEAGASESHGAPASGAANLTPTEAEEDEGKPPQAIEVGDLVTVERDGLLVFPAPVRVLEIKESGGATWVWTSGGSSWTEMNTVTLESKGAASPALPPPIPPAKPGLSAQEGVAMRTAVFPLPEGDASLTFPALLSPESLNLLGHYLGLTIKQAQWAKKAAPVLYGDTDPSAAP